MALGDVSGDGEPDVYLTANQKKNGLYVNKGDFEFEDVTKTAGVGGEKPWSTGAAMADVNGDGRLDIYVANSGQFGEEERKNELFINEGDGTFAERAEAYGIADAGNTIHAAFFDYDRDGDLDLFVLNNYASRPIESYDLSADLRENTHARGGDRLYRNDGGTFTDVTEGSGIYSSEIGFGLGVSAGDVNRDGWMDLYVSNDFFERDYLYINNRDGSFREEIGERMGTISTTSMGGDIADLNQDGFPEIFVTDMLPSSEKRMKTVSDFTDWNEYKNEIEEGYHRKLARNTLQYNDAGGTFSEIGRYAGVEATAWSWGALMADFNLNGRREIFVSNGFYKDVTDNDLALRLRDREVQKKIFRGGQIDYKKLMEITPSVPLSNYLVQYVGGVRFEDRAEEWGVGEPNFSNGAAYGDLDGDGDLDLVINNVNDEPFVYRNRARERHPERRWLRVTLEGNPPNTQGVGAQVEVRAEGRTWYLEQVPQRGFQSSVEPILHVGLGEGVSQVDTLTVRWPNGQRSRRRAIQTNQEIVVAQAAARPPEEVEEVSGNPTASTNSEEKGPVLVETEEGSGLSWKHEESSYNDFDRFPLLFHMRSTEGPCLCTGDADGDGRSDVYVGGASGQPGALFLHREGARFTQVAQPALEADQEAEDVDCTFFDADGDGRSELYVASGSSEFGVGHRALRDRLYRIESGEQLVPTGSLPSPDGGPVPTGVVDAADMDGDGAPDLFVGTRLDPYSEKEAQGYGVPVGGRLLMNDGTGTFADGTGQRAPALRAPELGAAGVTDGAWGDLDGDGAPDLVVVGEWLPIAVFFNRDGRLERAKPASVGLEETSGWWQNVSLVDLDGDGALDLIGGNHGLNSRFRASPQEPLEMWAADFGRSGQLDAIVASYDEGRGPYPMSLYQNLIQRLPHLKSRYSTFSDYAEETVPDIFGRNELEGAEHYRADQMASLVAWNDGDGRFQVDSLPARAQWAPMYDSWTGDATGDGTPEVLMGGNLHAVQPQAGAYDATDGIFLKREARRSYRAVSSRESGFSSAGEIREIASVPTADGPLIIVARNDEALQVFRPVSH